MNRAISGDETFGVATSAMHQGGIVSTPKGEWWGFSMMDYNSVGRLTCLSPVTWQDGWPYFGLTGNLGRTPRIWKKPDTGHVSQPSAPYQRSDEFNGPRLANVWQWNHVPVADKWSLTARPGFLRLSSLPAADFWTARNTLTQRTVGPESTATAELDPAGLQEGDVAGLALLNFPYAWIGIRRTAEGLLLEEYDQRSKKSVKTAFASGRVWLRADCDFNTQKTRFSYRTQEDRFQTLGDEFKMVYQLRTFQGVRFALFNYNTGGKPGGHVDFAHFSVHEPHPRGLTRPIPEGRVIKIQNLVGGTVLAVKGDTLVGVPGTDPLAGTAAARFKVLARPLGQVALQSAADNRVVGVTGVGADSHVVMETPRPDDSQLFQWMEMPRGDLLLLSLGSHRYLQINQDGTVAAKAPGAQSQRQNRRGPRRQLLGHGLLDQQLRKPARRLRRWRPICFLPEAKYHRQERSNAQAAPSPPLSPQPGVPRALQVLDCYLVVEVPPDEVLFIDQHALHERILFEQLQERVRIGTLEIQRLLIPEPVTLPAAQAAALLEQREVLAELGLLVEDFGGGTVLLTGCPVLLGKQPPQGIVHALVDHLVSKERAPNREQFFNDLLSLMACHAAVRAGDRLTPEEITALLVQRHLAKDTHHCPHGRPTSLRFTRHDLDRQFRRIK